MNTSRRAFLAGGTAAAALTALGAGRADAADYGSGQLGNYTTMGRTISTADYIERAAKRDGIYLFGDSITVQTARALAGNLWPVPVAVNGWSGRPTTPAVDALEQWVTTYGAPRRLVMALGTNDIFNPTVMAAQIERVMALAGTERTVLWVNVQASRVRQPAAVQVADARNSGWVNAQIAEAAGRHKNLRIVQWAEFLAAKPSRLTAYLADGVHPTAPGADARNKLIRTAVLTS